MKQLLDDLHTTVLSALIGFIASFLTIQVFLADAATPYNLMKDVAVQINNNCSGTIIDAEKRYILTAAHCVNNSQPLQNIEKIVYDEEGNEIRRDIFEASILRDNENTDVAILYAETGPEFTSAADVSTEAPKVADQLFILSNPNAWEYVFSRGSVMDNYFSEPKYKPVPMMLLSASINPGSSGGGIFNADGDVIGVVSAKYGSTNYSLAVLNRYIVQELIDLERSKK